MSGDVNLTAAEVIAAAEVLEKVSRLYEYSDPSLGEWSAADLRAELQHISAHAHQFALRQEIAKAVEDKVIAGERVGDAVRIVLIDFEIRRED